MNNMKILAMVFAWEHHVGWNAHQGGGKGGRPIGLLNRLVFELVR